LQRLLKETTRLNCDFAIHSPQPWCQGLDDSYAK